MPDFFTLTCPTCGGRLEITNELERFACSHCGNEHIVNRGGGVVHLAPVFGKISKGVDNTASELAIVRLDKEISLVQSEFSALRDAELKSWVKGFVGAVIVICGAFSWYIFECAPIGLALIFLGIVGLYAPIANRKIKSKMKKMSEKYVELQSARKEHYEKLNRK